MPEEFDNRDPNVLDRISNRLEIPKDLDRSEYMDLIDEIWPQQDDAQ